MPYKYEHSDVTRAETRKFECDLECRQCKCPKKDGTRCNRKVCVWLPFCWQHMRSELGILVKDSNVVPGTSGLYADRDFSNGEMVAPYGGEVLTPAEILKRYGRPSSGVSIGPYLLGSVDSACTRYVASASNGAFGIVSPEHANVKFEPLSHRHGTYVPEGHVYKRVVLSRNNLGIKFWTIAERDIRKGEELVANYGVSGSYYAVHSARENVCARRGVVCDLTSRMPSKKKKR